MEKSETQSLLIKMKSKILWTWRLKIWIKNIDKKSIIVDRKRRLKMKMKNEDW